MSLSACTEESKSFTVPHGLRKIHVEIFVNQTFEIGIEDLVTHKTIEVLLKDAQVAVVEKVEADAILLGKIQKYVREPIAFDQNNVATLYRIYMVMQAELVSPRSEERFWVEPVIDHQTTYSTVAPPIETEAMAKERLAGLLANDMLTRVTQGWINLKK